MAGLETLYNHAGPFLMVLFRLSGLFVFAPAVSSPILPGRLRVLVCAVFALAIYPTIPVEQQNGAAIRMDWMSLGVGVISETLIGLVIGLVAALPIYAVQLGGLIMGQQMGVGLANVYNPALDIEGDTVGQFLLYLALAMFLSMGGLDLLFLTTAETFRHVPIGAILLQPGVAGADPPHAVFSGACLELIEGVVSGGFELALRVAAPVLCIIMVETVATAFLMKTMPQLNIMSIGFATKVLVAFLGLIVSMRAIGFVMSEDVSQTGGTILQWAESFRLKPDLEPAQERPDGG